MSEKAFDKIAAGLADVIAKGEDQTWMRRHSGPGLAAYRVTIETCLTHRDVA
jgi:hypothetical protein